MAAVPAEASAAVARWSSRVHGVIVAGVQNGRPLARKLVASMGVAAGNSG
jgi:hypothetical protein